MKPFAELRKCAQREMVLRRSVYPKLIAGGQLTAAQAMVELDRMLEVGLVMAALENAVEKAREEIAKIPVDQPVPRVSFLLDALIGYVDEQLIGYVDEQEKQIRERAKAVHDRIIIAKPGEVSP